ncbi:hypothetical protein A6R68_19346 [Neotoma lepida]|uniref:Uncharacterized protein n=1 Tax=Neotoma lepida TaxID=56216 RepID=A0A1A6HKQ7_NEOLE|nr:hypothetical protein A6R68_19346 [Neotoma lepida]
MGRKQPQQLVEGLEQSSPPKSARLSPRHSQQQKCPCLSPEQLHLPKQPLMGPKKPMSLTNLNHYFPYPIALHGPKEAPEVTTGPRPVSQTSTITSPTRLPFTSGAARPGPPASSEAPLSAEAAVPAGSGASPSAPAFNPGPSLQAPEDTVDLTLPQGRPAKPHL